MTNGARAQLVISSPVVWSNGSFRLEASGGAPCDLVLAPGGKLTIRNARVEIRGDVHVQDASLLRIEDSDFELWDDRGPLDYSMYWEGGEVSTQRSTIGGRSDTSWWSNFYLDDGLWTAEDTTIHDSGGVLVGNSAIQSPTRQGGTLIADGLFAGKAPDLIHMTAAGDVVLRNSAMGVSMNFFDGPSSTIPIDCDTTSIINHRVYGDPAVHGAVTHPIAGSPWRLVLDHTQVLKWQIALYGLEPTANARTYEFSNADNISVALHGYDLYGSPTLVGPWRNYYPVGPLPELPTAREPGSHAIPPGCGVTIGKVTIRSAPSQWTRLGTWSMYLSDSWPASTKPTDFTVHGPTCIGEIIMRRGKLRLDGIDGFDAGTMAATAIIYGDSRLELNNATVGPQPGAPGALQVEGLASAQLTNVKFRNVTLRTRAQTQFGGTGQGLDQGTIFVDNYFPSTEPGENLSIAASRPGSITMNDATPAQNDDLQNLDFEAGVASGVPQYWAGTGCAGRIESSPSPGSPGGRSFRYVASGSSGRIEKTLVIPAGVKAELHGWLRADKLPGGAWVECALEGSGGGRQSVRPALSIGKWVHFSVPTYTVQSGDATVSFVVRHGGGSGVEVLLDDFQVRIATFWEDDNFANLDFEEPRIRTFGWYPQRYQPPDYWNLIQGQTVIETRDLAPGTSGQRSAKVTTTATKATLSKRLQMLAPGNKLHVTGYLKPVTAPGNQPFQGKVLIGEGLNYWQLGTCNAVGFLTTSVPAGTGPGGGWSKFDLTYTVPSGSCKQAYTTIAIVGGALGDWFLVDDIKVTVQ